MILKSKIIEIAKQERSASNARELLGQEKDIAAAGRFAVTDERRCEQGTA